MVDGLAPSVAYFPVAALAALTAALVTLIVAINAWNQTNAENSVSSNEHSESNSEASDDKTRKGSNEDSSLHFIGNGAFGRCRPSEESESQNEVRLRRAECPATVDKGDLLNQQTNTDSNCLAENEICDCTVNEELPEVQTLNNLRKSFSCESGYDTEQEARTGNVRSDSQCLEAEGPESKLPQTNNVMASIILKPGDHGFSPSFPCCSYTVPAELVSNELELAICKEKQECVEFEYICVSREGTGHENIEHQSCDRLSNLSHGKTTYTTEDLQYNDGVPIETGMDAVLFTQTHTNVEFLNNDVNGVERTCVVTAQSEELPVDDRECQGNVNSCVTVPEAAKHVNKEGEKIAEIILVPDASSNKFEHSISLKNIGTVENNRVLYSPVIEGREISGWSDTKLTTQEYVSLTEEPVEVGQSTVGQLGRLQQSSAAYQCSEGLVKGTDIVTEVLQQSEKLKKYQVHDFKVSEETCEKCNIPKIGDFSLSNICVHSNLQNTPSLQEPLNTKGNEKNEAGEAGILTPVEDSRNEKENKNERFPLKSEKEKDEKIHSDSDDESTPEVKGMRTSDIMFFRYAEDTRKKKASEQMDKNMATAKETTLDFVTNKHVVISDASEDDENGLINQETCSRKTSVEMSTDTTNANANEIITKQLCKKKCLRSTQGNNAGKALSITIAASLETVNENHSNVSERESKSLNISLEIDNAESQKLQGPYSTHDILEKNRTAPEIMSTEDPTIDFQHRNITCEFLPNDAERSKQEENGKKEATGEFPLISDENGPRPSETKVSRKEWCKDREENKNITGATIHDPSSETHSTPKLSKANNGKDDDRYSCLQSPCDVTSVDAGTVHAGKARVVQGSYREHVIGKIRSVNCDVTPAELQKLTTSPAYNVGSPNSTMQMPDAITSSWNSHDPNQVVTNIGPDRLRSLDLLVDHLYALGRQGEDEVFCDGADDKARYLPAEEKTSVSASDNRNKRDSSGVSSVEDYFLKSRSSDSNFGIPSSLESPENYVDCLECRKEKIFFQDNILHKKLCDNSHNQRTEFLIQDTSCSCVSKHNSHSDGLTAEYPNESIFTSSAEDEFSETLSAAVSIETKSSDFSCDECDYTQNPSLNNTENLTRIVGALTVDIFKYEEPETDSGKFIGKTIAKSTAHVTDTKCEACSSDSEVFLSRESSSERELVLQNLKALTSKLKYKKDVGVQEKAQEINDLTTVEESNSLSSTRLPSEGIFSGETEENSEFSDFEEDSEMLTGDSPRSSRLQKLLERDKERSDRLKQISELENCEKTSHIQSPESKKISRNTLSDLESAIGHMQDLIGKEQQSQCFPKHESHINELQFNTAAERRTIDTGQATETDTKNAITSHSLTIQHDLNYDGEGYFFSTRNSTTFENLSPENIIFQRYSDNDSEYTPTKIIPKISETNRNRETISEKEEQRKGYAFGSASRNGEVEDAIASSGGRWRSHQVYESPFNYSHEEKNSLSNSSSKKAGKNSSSIEENLDISYKSKNSYLGKKKEKVQQTATDRLPSAQEQTKSEKSAQWRWRTNCASDVTSPLLQTERSLKRGEPVPSAARMHFGDDLKQQDNSMENGAGDPEISPSKTTNGSTTTPTPTKIKNLRFKLDPDIFDLPAENGYYDYEDEYNRRPAWRKQPKYQAFSSLELGRSKEPVKVVSVRTSVVPGGQKMVVKPVCVSEGQRPDRNEDSRVTVKHLDIDLRIRLETEGECKSHEPVIEVKSDSRSSPDIQVKRSYLSNPPVQSKRRSPVPDFPSWNQSLSPVSENCDFIPAYANSSEDVLASSSDPESTRVRCSTSYSDSSLCTGNEHNYRTRALRDSIENEIPLNIVFNSKSEDDKSSFQDSNNAPPFKDAGLSKGPVTSTPSRPSTLPLNQYRKYAQLPRRKFVPDPDAIERITGYKAAEETSQTKPPLPPMIRSISSHRLSSGAKSRIDQMRKRYLDSKSLIASQKADGSSKFEEFLARAQQDRAKLITSTPDLAAFEAAVRKQWSKTRKTVDTAKENTPPPSEIPNSDSAVRCSTPDDDWVSYVQLLRRQLNRRSQSLSYLETDIDAFFAEEDTSRSMTTLERSPPDSTQSLVMPDTKENRITIGLAESGRTKSEHELRIEKSLQSLTLPDWYKNSQRPKSGFILEKKTGEKKGWAAVKSLTSSTSSLSSAGSKPKRPARSLRTSSENLIWSRGSASPNSADNSYSRFGKNNGPVLSLALAKAFREPYLGWRTRTPSSCASPSPHIDCSPPSWVVMDNTDRSDTPLTSDLQAMDEEDDDTGFSFEGEDVLETVNSSTRLMEKLGRVESPLPSADDTCEDVINISMDTYDGQPLINGHLEDDFKFQDLPNEDTCDDIKNMETFELGPPPTDEPKLSPLGDDTSEDVLNISTDTSSHLNKIPADHLGASSLVTGATENTVNDIDTISTDTSNAVLSQPLTNGTRTGSTSPMGDSTDPESVMSEPKQRSSKELKDRSRFEMKRKRHSYNRSIYHNELDGVKSLSDHDHVTLDASCKSLPGENGVEKDPNKVIWIESSFVGSRTTTSIMVMPTYASEKDGYKGSTGSNSSVGRPASR